MFVNFRLSVTIILLQKVKQIFSHCDVYIQKFETDRNANCKKNYIWHRKNTIAL